MARTYTAYTVSYDSESHWSVITQMWGSKWPDVLPYCIFNMVLMIVLTIAYKDGYQHLKVSSQAHTFLTLVVSFLLVSRVNIAMNRYNAARDCLGVMYRESRELIQSACVLSADNKDEEAKKWREELAYRALILLRTTMAVVNFPTTREPAWDVAELNGEEKKDVESSILISPQLKERWSQSPKRVQGVWQETMRVPIRIAYLLRKTIHNQQKQLKAPIVVSQENRLLSSVDGFMTGYYGIRKFLTTPVPFPLIQMARTFLFLYVFTVPFVMLSDPSGPIAHCIAVFILTYGFLGLELCAIDLDNPFGDDENDFDNDALACTAFEDTYLTIVDVDGPDWAKKVRHRMMKSPPYINNADKTSCYQPVSASCGESTQLLDVV